MLLQFFVRHSILFPFVLYRRSKRSKNREQEKDKHTDVYAVFHRAFSIRTDDNIPATLISFKCDRYVLNILSIDYYSFFNIKSS